MADSAVVQGIDFASVGALDVRDRTATVTVFRSDHNDTMAR